MSLRQNGVGAGFVRGGAILLTERLGVDFGVVNLAADNDGDCYANNETEKVRQKQNKVRRSLVCLRWAGLTSRFVRFRFARQA